MPKKRKNTRRQKAALFGRKKKMPCTYCGKDLTKDTATLDHVKPVSQGGYQRLFNVTLACRNCNHRKGSMSKDEFLKRQSPQSEKA